MNDAEYEEQRARVQALLDSWREPLGLAFWEVTLVYERGPYEVNGEISRDMLGSCTASWKYLTATITVNLALAMDHNDDQLEECFVHECIHALVNEMREWRDDERGAGDALQHEERVVTTLTRAIRWTYAMGVRDGLVAQPERALAEA